jgi:hypothetical protein
MGRPVVTSIRIDEDVLREAKALGLNVSKICENALKMAIERLRPLYERDEPRGRCGRRDLNPGRQLGRPFGHRESKLKQFDGRMENGENCERMENLEHLLEKFRDFCLIDLQLEKRTVMILIMWW